MELREDYRNALLYSILLIFFYLIQNLRVLHVVSRIFRFILDSLNFPKSKITEAFDSRESLLPNPKRKKKKRKKKKKQCRQRQRSGGARRCQPWFCFFFSFLHRLRSTATKTIAMISSGQSSNYKKFSSVSQFTPPIFSILLPY